MLGRTDSRLRMVAILLVFAVFGTATGLRLGYWQVVAADELTAQITRPASTSSEAPVRADIVDRNGALLAMTSSYDELVAYPDLIDADEQVPIIDTLGVLLGLSARERDRYLSLVASETQFANLRNRLTFEESEAVGGAIEAGLLPGIALEPKYSRWYPDDGAPSGATLAANILGYVRGDGRGGEGIERFYDERLTTVDPDSLDLASLEGLPSSLAGLQPAALELTIDAGLQKKVEQISNLVRITDDAKSVSVIVMDPHDGAILAAASSPSYDANQFAAVFAKDEELLRNRLFSDQFEPGSVMKIFTVTAALREGKVTPNTKIRDEVKLDYWDADIQNADHLSNGFRPVKDQIAESRNVVAAKLARMLAPQDTQKAAHKLYDFWATVGMTKPTEAGVANEIAGTWHDPDGERWPAFDLANRSFGQGVAVTLPQLARGVSTLVNGGTLVQPHFVVDGEAAGVEPVQVLDAKYAHQAKAILRHVTGSVTRYAERALIPGYQIGGKTGTAQIWDTRTARFKARRFNHSFIGYVGGRDSEYVIAVRLEEPKPLWVKQGSLPLKIESTDLFRRVALATIDQLDMRKSKDKNAGRPIIGTAAAAALDPIRDREARNGARQDARREQREEARADKIKSTRPKKGRGPDTASDPESLANESP